MRRLQQAALPQVPSPPPARLPSSLAHAIVKETGVHIIRPPQLAQTPHCRQQEEQAGRPAGRRSAQPVCHFVTAGASESASSGCAGKMRRLLLLLLLPAAVPPHLAPRRARASSHLHRTPAAPHTCSVHTNSRKRAAADAM
jgi:hypothetical protein